MEYFRTSNFSLAVGLHATDQLRFLNCEAISTSRVEFVFSDPEHKADELELAIDRGDIKAPVGAVLASLRYLRRKTSDALREACRG
jgi:hypothetical protein